MTRHAIRRCEVPNCRGAVLDDGTGPACLLCGRKPGEGKEKP